METENANVSERKWAKLCKLIVRYIKILLKVEQFSSEDHCTTNTSGGCCQDQVGLLNWL